MKSFLKPLLSLMLVFGLILPVYAGLNSKVTVNFRDTDIRAICRVLARQAGKNFIAGRSVRGNCTLTLKKTSVKTAFDMITKANGLGWAMQGNTILVNEEHRLPAQSQYVALKHVGAQLVAEALNQLRLHLDIATLNDQNAIVFRGPQAAIDSARKIITRIDRPHPVFKGRIYVRRGRELLHSFTFQGKPGKVVMLDQEYVRDHSDDPRKKTGKFMSCHIRLIPFKLSDSGHLQGNVEVAIIHESLKSQKRKTSYEYKSAFIAARKRSTTLFQGGPNKSITVELTWE